MGQSELQGGGLPGLSGLCSGGPRPSRRRSSWTPWWRSPSPPGGSPSGPPGDSIPQGPPRQSFIWQNGLTLDQSIADMNKSVMQLGTAQQAASLQLQLQTQQNQAVKIAHMDALRSLAESTQQSNFDHIFVNIPTYDRTNKKVFLKWVERLEAACLQGQKDIHTEALDKTGGEIKTCLMGLPMNLLWNSV